jgi:hypothetical protein
MSETTTPSWVQGLGATADMTGDKKQNITFRMWLKPGENKKVVFITDGNQAPVIWEHNYQAMQRGKRTWTNWMTCLQSAGETCPMCQFSEEYDLYRRYKIQLFAVIDLTPWVNKRTEKKHEHSRRSLTIKSRMQEKLMRKYLKLVDDGKVLTGAQFTIYRSADEKSPSTGDDFEYDKHIDLSSFPEDVTAPLDFEELAPDAKKMREIVAHMRAERGGSVPVAPTPAMGGPVYTETDDADPPPAVEVDYA